LLNLQDIEYAVWEEVRSLWYALSVPASTTVLEPETGSRSQNVVVVKDNRNYARNVVEYWLSKRIHARTQVIVCGYGTFGNTVSARFRELGRDVVVPELVSGEQVCSEL